MKRAAVLVALAACGGGKKTTPDAARCDPTAPFGAPAPISELDTNADEVGARLTADELVIVFARGNGANLDLYTASRTTTNDAFGVPALLASVNSVYTDSSPTLSPDQLLLFFDSTRTSGMVHIYSASRSAATAPFGPPMSALALSDGEDHPLLANATGLYFASATRPGLGMHDLWRADVDASGATSMPVAVIGPVNSGDDEDYPVITPDELQLYFVRTNSMGSVLYEATRATTGDTFTTPTTIDGLAPMGSTALPSWVSPDGCHLYVSSDAPGGAGGRDLYVASR